MRKNKTWQTSLPLSPGPTGGGRAARQMHGLNYFLEWTFLFDIFLGGSRGHYTCDCFYARENTHTHIYIYYLTEYFPEERASSFF